MCLLLSKEVEKKMDRKLSSTQKVWLSGSTLVVSIPRNVKDVMGIHKGDYLEIDWGEIIKRADNKKHKKEVQEESNELPDIE